MMERIAVSVPFLPDFRVWDVSDVLCDETSNPQNLYSSYGEQV